MNRGVRLAIVIACALAAAGAIGATVVAGDECEELRFDRVEWAELDRREYASCVVERQPFRGLKRPALVRRLGPPDERGRRQLRWWIGADEMFGMKIDALVIPLDEAGRAGPARIGRTG